MTSATRFTLMPVNPLDYGARLNDPDFDNSPIISEIIDEGGAIKLPSWGELWIYSPILLNRSYVSVKGINAGTRSNADPEDQPGWTHPGGGSKIVLGEGCPSAFWAPKRFGQPRISSIQLEGFMIQGFGAHRGQLGINIEHDNDAVRILGVSTVNIETGVRLHGADAAMIRGCWLSEVRNSIVSTGSSQQLQIACNHLGGQPEGKALYLENPNWANVVGNHIYPDAHTCIEAVGALDCQFTANQLQSYYTGAVIIKGDGNQFSGKIQALRSNGNWVPDPIGRDGLYGLVHIEGNDNHICASSINSAQPSDHTRILIANGNDNWISDVKMYGVASNRKVIVNGSCQGTRIVNSAPREAIDTGGADAAVIW